MEATSSRTGRPSGSSDISSDAWLCVGLRIIRKYKKTFTTKFILAGLSEWSTQAFHFMKPFLAMRKGGDSDCRDPVFDPADAVSDPKMVRIWGNPTRFSLFFLTPQMQSLTLRRYVFWGIQLAFPCFLSEKRGEGELFVR